MGLAELLLILLVGGAFCAGVAGLIGFVVYTVVKASKVADAGAEAVRSGQVPDLLPWTKDSLTTLSADWVGASVFTRGIGGATDKASGLLQSVAQPGTVLAFHTSARGRVHEGRVDTAGPFRVNLEVAQGQCRVTFDGAALGTVALATGALTGPAGQPLGQLLRENGDSALLLAGVPVALVSARTESHEARPAQLRPLLLRCDAPTAEAQQWTLAACLLELAWHGVLQTNASIRTR